MEPNQTQQNSGFKAIYGVIIAIIALAGGFIFWNYKQNSTAPLDTTVTTDGNNQGTTPVVGKKKYFDGTYTASGAYVTPEGGEQIDITLLLKDGIITDATFLGKATDKASKTYQDFFSKGFKTEVVGKSIDEVSLTVVNGASLTPKGFMDALNKIKVQAQTKA